MTGPQDPFATPDPNDPQNPPQGYGQQPPPPYGEPGSGQQPQPYGQQPPPTYGQQPFGTAPAPSGGNGLAIGALVLGLLSLVTWFLFIGGLFGIVAVVLGFLALGRVKAGQGGGRGMAIAGIVTGAIGVLLTGLVIAGVAVLFNTGEFSNLRECLQDAGSDQASIDECAREFEGSVG